MQVRTGQEKRAGAATALLIAAAVSVLALPSAVLAFSSGLSDLPQLQETSRAAEGFQPVALDAKLARSISVRALDTGKLFRFTPASMATRPDRLVTVAVRVDSSGARRIAAATRLGPGESSAGSSGLGIAPTTYNLGVSRGGYKGFGQTLAPAPVDIRHIEMPDLASFKPDSGAKGDPSRFSPRIALEERTRAGQSPRTFAGDRQETVDLGGSYRLTRNLNVTAGVRYARERDRLAPLTDGKRDNQAVYVGTQFRF